jgi:hypothetical protein
MIKSVFVGLDLDVIEYKPLSTVGANHIIVSIDKISKKYWNVLTSSGCKLAISLNAFEKGECVANPSSQKRLKVKIKEALKWGVKEVWLDHFRFDGYWEAIKNTKVPSLHQECKWCRSKDRVRILSGIAKSLVRKYTKIKFSYFAVPFKSEDIPSLVKYLGQDHGVLGKIFYSISPMLYHRMIQKNIKYISDYVRYLYKLTGKSVLPIIQVKDMPDNLEDKLSQTEFNKAYYEAKKSPSSGVCVFMWEHAIEKKKEDFITKVFS